MQLLSSQAEVARKMLRAMPERAREIILGGDFGGSNLVILQSEIHRPSFRDLWFLKSTRWR
jgi:hypothetical protein